MDYIHEIGKRAKAVSTQVQHLSQNQKNEGLRRVAEELENQKSYLTAENEKDIEKAESIALGDPASVPVGQYSEEALTSLGIWDKIQDKVSFGTNVTEVLNQVAAASADAGIVYATDAASMADQVKVVAEAPEGSLAKKVIYPVAVVKDTANAEAAGNFVEFLKTDEAMKVFESYGFTKGE